jgi:hypothetical protein
VVLVQVLRTCVVFVRETKRICCLQILIQQL